MYFILEIMSYDRENRYDFVVLPFYLNGTKLYGIERLWKVSKDYCTIIV